jgi:hypothetical protein
MTRSKRRLAFAGIVVFGAGLVYAADQTILGNSITVKNPSTPNKRKVILKGKEKASPNTVMGNPTVAGGEIDLQLNGGTPSFTTWLLPQGTSGTTGKPFWSGDAVKGFKYKDSKGENGTGQVKTAQIKKSSSGAFTIKAVIQSKFNAIPPLPVPPNPGTSSCGALILNGGDSYSIAFKFGDGVITNKGSTLYKHKKVTMQDSCFVTTTTTSSSTSSTTSTTLYGSPSRAFVDRVMSLLD